MAKMTRDQRIALLLDVTLFPYFELSSDKHDASAHAHIVLRDGTRLSFGDWKAQLKVAIDG